MGSRHKAREFGLKILYQIDVCNKSDVEEAIQIALALTDHNGVDMGHALRLVRGVMANNDTIADSIRQVTSHWRVDRMDVVDRNILRIAFFELFYCDDIPFKVAIDEAIELGKAYGTKETPQFINGVLDAAVKRFSDEGSQESRSL